MPKCEKHYIYRTPYTRTTKSGKSVKVKGGCIKSRSITGKKRSSLNKLQSAKKLKKENYAELVTGTSKLICPPGMIKRAGYLRKTHKRHTPRGDIITISHKIVPAKCIKSRGVGSSVRIPVTGHDLGKYGYHSVVNMNKQQRHRALNKAVNDMGYLPVIKKLNALSILSKNTNPNVSSIFKLDQEWLSGEYKKGGKVKSVIYK
jgi:hypothetical protein